jgi:hypothetical protein
VLAAVLLAYVLEPITSRLARRMRRTLAAGIFGGVAVFGVVGLFFGPILLGMLKVVVEVLVRTPPDAGAGPSVGDGRPASRRRGEDGMGSSRPNEKRGAGESAGDGDPGSVEESDSSLG